MSERPQVRAREWRRWNWCKLREERLDRRDGKNRE